MGVPRPGAEAEHAHAVSEMLPDGLITVDPHGIITHVNQPALTVMGGVLADFVGRPVREALPLRDRAGYLWWDVIDSTLRLDTTTGHREKLLLLPNGRGILVTARYLRTQPRGPILVTLMGVRSAEARQRAEADHAALITTVAHELRSPLTGLKGFSSTLLNRWDRFTDEQKRFMVETIEADADRLARLITDLLDISRLDSGRFRIHRVPIDLRATFERHAERLVAGGLDSARIELDVAEGLPTLWADADRLDQILSNLLENAIQHGAGRITLGAKAALTSDGELAIDVGVCDEGAGIPPAQREVVFSRFWQGGHRAGTGLGLYLVQGIAAAHGGEASALDAPKGGACVRVRLPAGGPTPPG